MEVIQQTSNNTCLACVLAMIVGESEKYVIEWFEHIDPPLRDEDAFLFLAHHGFYLATGFDFETDNPNGTDLSKTRYITIKIDLTERSCYLVVNSPSSPYQTHAVFLYEGKVYDPLKAEPQSIDGYKVRWCYPIMATLKRGRRFFQKSAIHSGQ